MMVDATDTTHRIFTVRETVPVAGAGDLVLLSPQWLPGTHATSGTIDSLAGLTVSAAGAPLAWHRDPVDVFAFQVLVPRGRSAVDLEFQYLSPVKPDVGTLTVAREALALDWNTVVLYPAGYFSRRVPIKAGIRLLPDWSIATSLDTDAVEGATTTFQSVSVETLVDSPLGRVDLAGCRHADPRALPRSTLTGHFGGQALKRANEGVAQQRPRNRDIMISPGNSR